MRFRPLLTLAMLPLLAAAAGPATRPTAAPAPPTPTPAADDPVRFDMYDYLRTMAADRARDPIGPIAERLGTAALLLGDAQTGTPVQDRQRSATADLDGVIKELEAQCKGGGGGSANPTTPLGKSIITGGPGGSGPLHDAQAGTRVWGQLPAKDRDQITQSQTEGFPPGYESVLASYYGRLSQEQVAADRAAPGPTTQPSAGE